MSDLIRRKDAINAVKHYFEGLPIRARFDLIDAMAALPSAQSTMGQVNDTAQLTNDCIGRQDAIDAAIEAVAQWDGVYSQDVNTRIRDGINSLPSAQKWVPCSIRVPEKNGYYLTATIHENVYLDYWNGFNFDRSELVIAWAEMPEPYPFRKGEQDG